ncbi:GPP34 family phosphoprotein [Amycolatopsis sp. RTGN1]|uniref:GPP34 family phosphoprotein n=1 Tax=Amycolatopsis ponsaeliensis TaxID=2992142 RepID=UPI00254DC9C4|nr:GPP34 family phosphoprotein [Amycolatopsis sp. RTGN1]
MADLLLAANHAGDIQLDPVVRDRATMELTLAAAVLIDLTIEKRIRIEPPGCVRIIAGNPGDDPLSHRVVHDLRRIAQPRSVTDSLYVLADTVTPLVWMRLAHRGDAQPRHTRCHRRPRFDFVGLRAIRRPHLYLTAAADHDPIDTTAASLWRLLTLLNLDDESTDLMLSNTTTARLNATEPAPQVTAILSVAALALHVHATAL